MLKNTLAGLLLLGAAAGCHTTRSLPRRPDLSAADARLADSLVTVALDNEALFTLLADLKPLSSVATLYLPLARPDSVPAGAAQVVDSVRQRAALARLRRYQRVVNSLDFGDVVFSLAPFRASEGGRRVLQLNVYRRSRLRRLLTEEQAFFGQWGFGPGTAPEVVLTAVEYENRADRYRGYGYLFGYPRHAVDFFVRASLEQDANGGKLVPRQFFQVPVFSGSTGRFTWALPQGQPPTPADSALYRAAAPVLARYRQLRPRYLRPDGTLRARDLLRAAARRP